MYEKLRKIRNDKGVKGEEMANLLGLKKATYSKKENGQVKFLLEEAKKIADFFDMPIEEVFFIEEVSINETLKFLDI